MTLVLDRSGSMGSSPSAGGSGGGQYLPAAVTAFINDFDDTIDKVAMVKFSTIQNNVVYGGAPPQPVQPFKSQIINAVNAFTWNGATFAQGGLTNALVLENNAFIPPNENFVKVVVFFTDGMANTVQDALNCTQPLVNFGGIDNKSVNTLGIFDPTTGTCLGSKNGSVGGCPGDPCPSVTTFHAAYASGASVSLVRANVSQDAEFRSVETANEMRAAGIIVYSIGLGTGNVDVHFLRQVANDPSLAGTPGYAPTLYDGEAVIANDPAELKQVFELIAGKILLRLTQ
jgi:hypothetical protein